MAIPAPHYGPWTEQDLLALPDDGQRHEVVEGVLLVSPSPGSLHQRVAKMLVRLLDDAAPAHLEAIEALGVRIPGGSLLIPDVLVGEKAAILANNPVLEPNLVHLVIEIVSPGSVIMDRTAKPVLYAQAGILNFWRVEVVNGPSVTAYCLEGDNYKESGSAQAGQTLTVAEPFEIKLDPGGLIR
jgi:Uma2 family endonuclease